MNITYIGKIVENGNEYSSFLLGVVDSFWMDKFRREVEIQFFDRTHYIYYLMVRYYVRTSNTELWKWINEVELPYGGDIQILNDKHQIILLLTADSPEETAFRLKHNIKE